MTNLCDIKVYKLPWKYTDKNPGKIIFQAAVRNLEAEE